MRALRRLRCWLTEHDLETVTLDGTRARLVLDRCLRCGTITRTVREERAGPMLRELRRDRKQRNP